MTSRKSSLTTSTPPTNSKAITALVKDHEARVSEIDREIQTLVERRTAHMNVINKHAPFIAPVRRLSQDVLVLIFQACIRNESTPLSRPVLSKNNPAIIASHVCAEWRKLALANPLLWTDLIISVPQHPRPRSPFYRAEDIDRFATAELRQLYREDVGEWEERMERLKDAINAWIARSSNCPVNITFTCTDLPRTGGIERQVIPSTLISDIVAILTNISARWREASFSVTIRYADSPLRQLLQQPVDRVPILEKLHLELGYPENYLGLPSDTVEEESPRSRPKELIRSVSLFNAPSLRSLKVDNHQKHWATSSVPVNWGALTELCLGGSAERSYDSDWDDNEWPQDRNPGADKVLTLLKSCPNLVRFSITLDSTASSPGLLPLPTPISLLKLETIELRGGFLPKGFASSLYLPSLRRVSILWSRGRLKNAEESELLEWFRCFGGSLTDVTFNYSCLRQGALLNCLELLPNVVCLRLVNSSFSYHESFSGDIDKVPAYLSNLVLEKLTPKFERDVNGTERVVEEFLCPKLEKFGAAINSYEFLPQALVELIAARRKRLDDLRMAPHSVSRLNCVIVAFKVPKRNIDVRKALEDRNVDLEDFQLKTTYEEVSRVSGPLKDNSWYDPDWVLGVHGHRP